MKSITLSSREFLAAIEKAGLMIVLNPSTGKYFLVPIVETKGEEVIKIKGLYERGAVASFLVEGEDLRNVTILNG